MAVVGDSEKKRRGGKVFGSLERGLDKMITMLTPNKRRALRDGPRKIKVRSETAPPPRELCAVSIARITLSLSPFPARRSTTSL